MWRGPTSSQGKRNKITVRNIQVKINFKETTSTVIHAVVIHCNELSFMNISEVNMLELRKGKYTPKGVYTEIGSLVICGIEEQCRK